MRSDIALFLFAHQDDEFGVFAEIERCLVHGDHVIIVYLTSGELTGQGSAQRDAESVNVLRKLGVLRQSIYFLGTSLVVPDGKLVEYLQPCHAALFDLCSKIGSPRHLYFLAWEGGHQDHDAVHLIGVALGVKLGILADCRQFPLYNGEGLKSSLFKLFAPLVENGPAITYTIPWKNRFRYISYCLQYPSQFKTWVGLFPFLLFHYVFRGTQILQRISVGRLNDSAHPGAVLYARRGSYDPRNFIFHAKKFLRAVIGQES
ncbi:PIG-L family deacetylase [Herbaspirillum sp. RTI4]|uniref:PIG-L deacetylase family protein n=1 Tax=Herbaspirillum sp. RTI4 TaxID=3048640 RepID=UPI002AB4A828|nr:PIG-L family deacetylase [Herbaspirillum sp. RTI4]MDY7577612.1 PIG-L family deacetylase [Herbaspirillum sp. RTI4]MEA9983283.1 PIG-L family deacetylase [Herbaspirillum sp. RTI4]